MSQIYLLLINKERRLSNEALAKIADISEGIGHISFGSIALQFLVDNQSAGFLILGTISALGFWGSSIAVANLIK